MTQLDRSLFNKTISVPFIQINGNQLENTLKCVKPFLIKLNNLNDFETNTKDNNSNKITIILNPELISTMNDIIKDNVNNKQVLEEFCGVKELLFKEILITYDNFSYESIFDAIIPSDKGSVSQIGNILCLELHEDVLPYKHILGEVLLDKEKSIQVIVNKLTPISYGNRQMEVLAKRTGQPIDTVVKVHENGSDFEFDFAEVFWDQKLNTEYERIVSKLQTNVDVVYDIFSGVGRFAIPVAKHKNCRVIANEVNPDCYKWLTHNCKLNKVEHLIKTYNMDVRDFISRVVREDVLNGMRSYDYVKRRYHIVMNSPDLSIQLLDAFKGLFADKQIVHKVIPLIYCYCTVNQELDLNYYSPLNKHILLQNGRSIAKQMVEQILGHKILIEDIIAIKTVAPNMHRFLISFYLPKDSNFSSELSGLYRNICELIVFINIFFVIIYLLFRRTRFRRLNSR